MSLSRLRLVKDVLSFPDVEGYMPEDIHLWQDLYLQVHQYTTQIVSVVVGLQVMVDRVISEKG